MDGYVLAKSTKFVKFTQTNSERPTFFTLYNNKHTSPKISLFQLKLQWIKELTYLGINTR